MTNIITYIAIIVIIAGFIYFLCQSVKINSCRKFLDVIYGSDDPLLAMEGTKLSKLKESYQKSIKIKTEKGLKSNIPASEYFSEQTTSKCYNCNLRMLDAASSTLVGLGLLGTFLGLTLGIRGFDSSNTENIQSSIQSLLSGMGTAFVTSLAGMLLSLIYTVFIEKPWKNKLAKSLTNLTEKLDEEYYIDDMSLMDINQRTILTELRESILDTLDKRLSYTNETGQKTAVANAVREILKENEEQSKALKSFSTDLAVELNNGFDEVLSKQMQEKLLPLMENIDGTTKAVIEHIDQMADNVASPATDMIQNVVNELKTSMTSIMQEFKNKLTSDTANELEGLSKSLSLATQAMTYFPKNMGDISDTLQVTMNEVRSAISEISNTSAANSNTAMQKMQEQITFVMASISDAISGVKEVMSSITHSSEQSSNEVITKIATASHQMSDFMNDAMAQMSSSMQASIKEVLSGVNSSLIDVTKAVSSITQSSEQSCQGVINQLDTASEKLNSLMDNTMSNITSSMRNSIKNITDDITDKQVNLMALQDSTVTETKKLLVLFTNGISRLEQINTAVSGTMDMFQKAQGEITGSTANLSSITGDMKVATEVFHKSQNDYTGSVTDMQLKSQRNIDEITELMKNSGEMSDDYVHKFETIRSGLASIFSQIQKGLNEYSQTVQATTQKYLDQYSTSLTKTTDALSSTIQLQTEAAEMLTEALNKKRE